MAKRRVLVSHSPVLQTCRRAVEIQRPNILFSPAACVVEYPVILNQQGLPVRDVPNRDILFCTDRQHSETRFPSIGGAVSDLRAQRWYLRAVTTAQVKKKTKNNRHALERKNCWFRCRYDGANAPVRVGNCRCQQQYNSVELVD